MKREIRNLAPGEAALPVAPVRLQVASLLLQRLGSNCVLPASSANSLERLASNNSPTTPPAILLFLLHSINRPQRPCRLVRQASEDSLERKATPVADRV